MNCQARILDVAKTIPNTKLIYHTTTECGGELSKKLFVDSRDAQMNICSCCFRRYNSKAKQEWYGWFDGSYPPEAKVLGSKWYHEQLAASTQVVEPEEDGIDELQQGMESMRLSEEVEVEAEEVEAEEVEAEAEAEAEAEVDAEEVEVEAEEEEEEEEVEVEAEAEVVETKEEKKAKLKARIKELQVAAKPGKMSLKEIQAAFKEITNLKTQIHML